MPRFWQEPHEASDQPEPLERQAEHLHALKTNALVYAFSCEAHEQKTRALQLETDLKLAQKETARVAAERDASETERGNMRNTLGWRAHQFITRIPLFGNLMERLGQWMAQRNTKPQVKRSDEPGR